MLTLLLLTTLLGFASTLPYDPAETDYNLNQNQSAKDPVNYWGQWQDHEYYPSPTNWRFPFYTIFLDRLANGDPTNDNVNGTLFEYDITTNQLRHGGDLAGLVDSLDYIQGLGVRGIYVAGTPFINFPWKSDSYSPLDLTLLDKHYGTIKEWRTTVDEIHKRGMYIILDSTGPTLGDLLVFGDHDNSSAPFQPEEYTVGYKSVFNRQYFDFQYGNTYQKNCEYPRFWNQSGQPVLKGSDPVFDQLAGCYDSDFDQYGDTEAFGLHPDWQRQLSKFAAVQDRLREWKPSVRDKLANFACLTVSMLDVDGYRFDKATQITVDALADISQAIRTCTKELGKDNFFISGEITGGNDFGSTYLGRGREPQMRETNLTSALLLTGNETDKFIRDEGKNALDAAAFHYSVYRSLRRFLGLDGNLEDGYDVPVDFVTMWNIFITSNDLVNPNTGEFDPRHMYGVTNQDVFRWPAITDGVQRMLLGMFITNLHMPGIPLMLWGEEQSFYVLDSTNANYIFGRQPMSSNQAWQDNGCYTLGSTDFYNFPLDAALHGCTDDSVSLDHRDPTHPVRNIVKAMHDMRTNYPAFVDGWLLQKLSNQTHQIVLPGSNGTATEIGVRSVLRDYKADVQKGITEGNQSIWLLYHNDNKTVTYSFDCSSSEDSALIAPFAENTVVKNLFPPYDELTLDSSNYSLGIDGSADLNGCLSKLTLAPYEFAAYVPKSSFIAPSPVMTKFVPGHDARIISTTDNDTVDIEFHYSDVMDCDSLTNNLQITSTSPNKAIAEIQPGTVSCAKVNGDPSTGLVGERTSAWKWAAKLSAPNGIHMLTVQNVTSEDGTSSTDSVDHLMIRIGKVDNPIVFPRQANYSYDVLGKDGNDLQVTHTAAGADKWRYSLNWASSWSDWMDYDGEVSKLNSQPWSGTSKQKWSGEHVILQYWSQMAGSSSHQQHGDLNWHGKPPRRFPHLFAHGKFNDFGLDSGLSSDFGQDDDGIWNFHYMTEWKVNVSNIQVNVWGMNPDKKADVSFVFGDINNDTVLERIAPDSTTGTVLNITKIPPEHYLAYRMEVNDDGYGYKLVPTGRRHNQVILCGLLFSLPVAFAVLAIQIYLYSFAVVKFNRIGVEKSKDFLYKLTSGKFQKVEDEDDKEFKEDFKLKQLFLRNGTRSSLIGESTAKGLRRTVLIATMEYDIEDWSIKVKIGGLGVMAQLMGKNLEDYDLIWVVPCCGGIEYPTDTPAPPIQVTIMGKQYDIDVQYHKLKNITYVLLDAPIFRKQTKADPYPPRMDDLESAIYYSAWNASIAAMIRRFPIDIYHINDYHGAAAPLYLLPDTIPCCLSLHNAEFQGLWPMRNTQESEEVCHVYNLDSSIVQKYVQFGEVFNLLHAGASYLRIHQRGFGAVGVSRKYGARSYARYPIFWGLKEIGSLPNPDPSDTAPIDPNEANQPIVIDPVYEASRADLRKQAQEWAGLTVDPTAELFVFVGRWSVQKGVDLIADVFPTVLDKNPKVQLICIGPVIDLYGKFAALKLETIMKKYPGRVYSKPEFTALPPYIFSGAEFALIPSRDEPFGLVAVEFGRKGALGVGARVGGLGQMPGWWYTVESVTVKHLAEQFTSAINDALATDTETRAMMRARSAKQRFPVRQWIQDLEKLYSKSIQYHQEDIGSTNQLVSRDRSPSIAPMIVRPIEDDDTAPVAPPEVSVAGLSRSLSLGTRFGPGHVRHAVTDASMGTNLITVGEEDEDEDFDHRGRFGNADEVTISQELAERNSRPGSRISATNLIVPPHSHDANRGRGRSQALEDLNSGSRDRSASPSATQGLLAPDNQHDGTRRRSALLSLSEVAGDKTDYKLQKVDPTFSDSTGQYAKEFEGMLQQTDDLSSEDVRIGDFLNKSEKAWFKKFRDAKLGRSEHRRSFSPSIHEGSDNESNTDAASIMSQADEFLLGENYQRPSALKRLLQSRIGDWPVYSILLALGQIMSVNSYQITLLSGGQGETSEKLYIIGAVFIVTSCLWWVTFRTLPSIYVLSLPWLFYGATFGLIGIAPFLPQGAARDWLRNIAAGTYTAASSSGSIFFALNFGDEGGSPIKSWVLRACIIQGTQQIYLAALFYWGSTLITSSSQSNASNNYLNSKTTVPAITLPVLVLCWAIGIILFTSLPPYYRQSPGKTPYFYKALLRRKIVAWFFIMIILQNYWLSAPYGRNWQYLWSSTYVKPWQIALLALAFFLGVWSGLLAIFAKLSTSHSWILPIFAIGLGAPRWCQMLWGTSGYGLWVPWVGGPVAGAILGRSLWLWLGVLDAIQGVGFGMMLLNTLTRMHIAVTLMVGQLLGSVVTLIAKATAPDRDGPGDVFPNFSAGIGRGLSKPVFWIALVCQLIIPVGFLLIFRKAQLSKP